MDSPAILGTMKRVSPCLLALCTLLACNPQSAPIEAGEVDQTGEIIFLDGRFDDWAKVEPAVIDPVGDVAPGAIDFSQVKISNDNEYVLLKIDLGRETIWQNEALTAGGNDIRIYFDAGPPQRSSSGTTRADLTDSAEQCHDLEIHLGSKSASICRDGLPLSLSLNEVGMFVAPTHSSSTFEIAIPYSVHPQSVAPVAVIGESEVSIYIAETQGGDRVPDEGRLKYQLLKEVSQVEPISLLRQEPGDIRVLSHNALYTGPANRPDHFRRYLLALQPDIVNFQELWEWSEEQAEGFMNSVLGGTWHVAKVDDCVTASRFPITDRAALLTNLIVRIDLPDGQASTDLVLFNAHTPCCGDNTGRDYVHDLIASSWRDLLSGNGVFTINENDTVVMLGDFNMVGFHRQLKSLRDGEINNHERFGPDFSPARERGSLTEVPLRHTHTRHFYTWRADPAPFTPGKLDYILFSDDMAAVQNNFALWTPDMPQEVLQQHGLERNDSILASDHLVLVADFIFR